MSTTTWSSTTPSIQSEIILLGDNASLDTGGNLNSLLLPWANRIVVEICNEVNVRNHLKCAQATVTTDNYIWAMPTDSGFEYFKKHERFTKARVGDVYIDIIGIEELHELDPNHDETSTADTPDKIAIEGGYIYVYPLWAGTIVIENYFRAPEDMADSTDTPDIPNDSLRTDLIVAGVLGKYLFPATGETDKAKLYYNRSTNPKSGLFFDLLDEYKNYLKSSDTTWTNRSKFY